MPARTWRRTLAREADEESLVEVSRGAAVLREVPLYVEPRDLEDLEPRWSFFEAGEVQEPAPYGLVREDEGEDKDQGDADADADADEDADDVDSGVDPTPAVVRFR